jgi:thioredoxin-dependent peroxiredoxin
MRSLRDERRLAEFDIQIFGASTDPVDSLKMFAEALQLKFPLLSDAEGKIAKQFGVLVDKGYARRVTFVIDKEAIIRHVSAEVMPASHGADLVSVLEDLKIAKKAGPEATGTNSKQ